MQTRRRRALAADVFSVDGLSGTYGGRGVAIGEPDVDWSRAAGTGLLVGGTEVSCETSFGSSDGFAVHATV